MRPLIALIDGPLRPDHPALALRAPADEGASADSPGAQHAAAMAQAILAGAPEARFVSIAVFGQRLVTDAETLAAALESAAEAHLVHCSLGLPRPDPRIEAAVAALLCAGRLVVAATPARGGPVWPAACPGVLSVQGDARCGPGDWSFLGLPTALFGACPRLDGFPAVAGASVAAAHLTGLIAGMLGRGAAPKSVAAELRDGAPFVGRERRW